MVHGVVRKIVDSWGGLDVHQQCVCPGTCPSILKRSSPPCDGRQRRDGSLSAWRANPPSASLAAAWSPCLPPVDLTRRDWIGATRTTVSVRMTIAALGFAERGVASNTLWPRHLAHGGHRVHGKQSREPTPRRSPWRATSPSRHARALRHPVRCPGRRGPGQPPTRAPLDLVP